MKIFKIFAVYVFWETIDSNKLNLSVPNEVSYGQILHYFPINITESACEFLDRVVKGYFNHDELNIDQIEEVEILFISDLKDMTYTHYMEQPKSMICPKKKKKFFEVKGEDINDFEYDWIPGCFMYE